MNDKRKFPRFPVEERIICSRYGKQVNMRTLNISRDGLKLETNSNVGTDEIMDFIILANGSRIRCRGMIVGVEESGNKVQARLRFAPRSDLEERKLSSYLHILSRKPSRRRTIDDSTSSLLGKLRNGLTKGGKSIRNKLKGKGGDEKLQMVNSWLELLPDTERTVITLRFGFNGEDPHTVESTGKRLNLALESIRQIESQAIEKLRKISQKKEVFLEDIL
jgi:hypothetical protein